MNRKLRWTCFTGAACAALLIAATGCGTTIGDDSAVGDRSDARSEARSDDRAAPARIVARTVAPAGSVLTVEFIDPLSSETAQPGQTRPLTVDGRTANPSGAVVVRDSSAGVRDRLAVRTPAIHVQGQLVPSPWNSPSIAVQSSASSTAQTSLGAPNGDAPGVS